MYGGDPFSICLLRFTNLRSIGADYAATTYADHMLGKSLTMLESFGAAVAGKTITVFHADHGYQLGELNEWSKKTDTELATRVPMIIRVPWLKASVGQTTQAKAELVDMYRTLVDLSGFPAGAVESDVQGTSLAPVFADPKALGEKMAYSQIGSCACHVYNITHGQPPPEGTGVEHWSGKECGAGRCIHTPISQFDFMGYSVRDERCVPSPEPCPLCLPTSRLNLLWCLQLSLHGVGADGQLYRPRRLGRGGALRAVRSAGRHRLRLRL